MIDRIIYWLVVAGTALLGVRLYTSGLRQKYRAIFYYLIFPTLQSTVMVFLHNGPHDKSYTYAYIGTEPIGWIFYALVVLELYSLVLADYQGLYTVGRWALIIAVAMAVLASAASLLAPSRDPGHASQVLPILLSGRAGRVSELDRLPGHDSSSCCCSTRLRSSGISWF